MLIAASRRQANFIRSDFVEIMLQLLVFMSITLQGLNEVLGKNRHLCRPVLSLLLTQVLVLHGLTFVIASSFELQWKKFYEAADDVNPPFKLEMCIVNQGGSIHIVEPLVSDPSNCILVSFQFNIIFNFF
jgi:hypothetical protein